MFDPIIGKQDPIVGVVGELQFDVPFFHAQTMNTQLDAWHEVAHAVLGGAVAGRSAEGKPVAEGSRAAGRGWAFQDQNDKAWSSCSGR